MIPSTGDIARDLTIRHGDVDPDRLTLHAIVRDEMYLLPAFLDHHRRIGVEQFLIVDDGSTDGTAEFLAAQVDVAVLTSPHGFADPARGRGPLGQRKRARAGIVIKDAVAQRFLRGRHALHLDADEFLLLPPSAPRLRHVIDALEGARQPSVAASLVEFFPESLLPAETPLTPPEDFAALLADSPFFEAEPLLRLRRWRQPKIVGPSKTQRLFARFLPSDLATDETGAPATSPRLKTPILRAGPLVWRYGSHKANLPPAPDKLLTIAHFTFTPRAARKAEAAIDRGSHAAGGSRYRRMAALLAAMRAEGAGFLSERSERYADPAQLIRAGLMIWPERET